MIWNDIIFAFLMALIITIVFAVGFKNKGPWGTIWAFFLLIFLAVWSASLWVSPIGPLLLGYSIIPVAIVGVVFALIIAATAPPENSVQTMRHNMNPPSLSEKPALNTYSVYFWLVMSVLTLIIVFGYYIQYK